MRKSYKYFYNDENIIMMKIIISSWIGNQFKFKKKIPITNLPFSF